MRYTPFRLVSNINVGGVCLMNKRDCVICGGRYQPISWNQKRCSNCKDKPINYGKGKPPKCACGCGQKVTWYGKANGYWRKWLSGHNPPHNKGKSDWNSWNRGNKTRYTHRCKYCKGLFKSVYEKRSYCNMDCYHADSRGAEYTHEHFWNRVVALGTDKECWEWQGGKDTSNYGRLKVNGRLISAHRYTWEEYNGKIPKGLHVLHECDNPPCVNPKHLFLGTNADNVADRVAKNRQAKGETHAFAVLTEKDITDIIKMYVNGAKQKEIANSYKIDQGHVSSIVNRKKWKHVKLSKKLEKRLHQKLSTALKWGKDRRQHHSERVKGVNNPNYRHGRRVNKDISFEVRTWKEL
jgi:hypothetical protein